MQCVTTAKFSINLNKELVGFFSNSRGLRQGDSISPYLFVLVMEVFSCIMRDIGRKNDFTYHWRCKKEKLNHLCFADDVMIFSKGDVGSISLIKEALKEFYEYSGLMASQEKSNVFLSGVPKEEKEILCHVLGFQLGDLRIKYLGVPLSSVKPNKSTCQFLVEKFSKRINQ